MLNSVEIKGLAATARARFLAKVLEIIETTLEVKLEPENADYLVELSDDKVCIKIFLDKKGSLITDN